MVTLTLRHRQQRITNQRIWWVLPHHKFQTFYTGALIAGIVPCRHICFLREILVASNQILGRVPGLLADVPPTTILGVSACLSRKKERF